MHPAPSLAEAPPKSETPHPRQQPAAGDTQKQGHHPNQDDEPNGGRENHVGQPGGDAAPVRKDTSSSTATNGTVASLATLASTESTATIYSVEQSPTFATQGVFSVKDGNDVGAPRRGSRRRTGPLSPEQRERAALIRKLGACVDCRRRRVACHPNHHNMSWEQAFKKYRARSPSVGKRHISPAAHNSKPVLAQNSSEMEVDVTPAHQPGRPPLSEARTRTPLPSGPRPDKPPQPPSLPGTDNSKSSDIQVAASRVIGNPYRSRYAAASALFVYWEDDVDESARQALGELGNVLQQYYHYTFQVKAIPRPTDGCMTSFRWLSKELNDFMDQEQRDVLKIVYYSGHSYLDGNREMVIASSKHADPAFAIRWSGIQTILENAVPDTLLIMDAAYYPSSMLVRRIGVLELIAASTSEDHVRLLDRGAFTRALADQLKTRANQTFMDPLSAAELHVKILSQYPKMIQDRNPEKERVTSFPSPFHFQASGSSKLPSVLLAPIQKGTLPWTPDSPSSGLQVVMTFRLTEDTVSPEAWAECFRWMPEGIKDIKVEGPFRNTFR
ncbi:hypothetical protein QBC47DRAFT_155231 [Echria macrotheca]|uniref:Tyrosine-protein phosphatase non-receptor type 6 n=1 Tax=Echria macrotheca TaxID=438768 RepID=A0AAJ0BG55_9PEZI|nr:hypothetical protein QBC47DRAFT_155231 [Echria macrotheca]